MIYCMITGYSVLFLDVSQEDVRLAFAKEASTESAKEMASNHARMHPTELIAHGLQIEEQQYFIDLIQGCKRLIYGDISDNN